MSDQEKPYFPAIVALFVNDIRSEAEFTEDCKFDYLDVYISYKWPHGTMDEATKVAKEICDAYEIPYRIVLKNKK